ncbi:hypothetical protein BC937DRAFT_91826 [Endogone sp. FLAS-F59071]|nr:hypothetical protein BC937DRAFT_91826 [Endogone sp. FLAS-F59071]|eukprot:RUS15902.1 hypothetical protein BC937DRAFT_91826 [Endogone sp. FLAS-F59071]
MPNGIWSKVVTAIVALVLVICIVLFFVFNKPIMAAVQPLAQQLREIPGGYLIIVAVIIITSIPPVVGFSAFCYVSGFVYGFPMGIFPVVAGAFCGAILVFALVRTFNCTKYVERFTKTDNRYLAMEEAVEEGGFGIILLIRLSPIPFSIQNAFFAIIPKVKFWQFGLATILAVWKLIVDVWIGSTLANLADTKLDPTARIVSYCYIAVGVLFLAVATWWIYRVTMRKVRAMALRHEGKLAGIPGTEHNFVAEPMLRDGSRSPFEDDETVIGGNVYGNGGKIMKPKPMYKSQMEPERVVLEEVESNRVLTPASYIP